MTKGSPAGGEITITIGRKLARPEDPPRTANRFFFTAVNEELQLDIAYLDLVPLRESIELAKSGQLPNPIEAVVYARFSLPPSAALDLLATVQKMVEHLRMSGKLPNEPEQPEKLGSN